MPLDTLWTFPAIVFAAILIAWATECGQFYISQGLALAVLAWVQTLPEFAVEAAIALEAAHDPAKMGLVTANFTGSLRLFVGLGWPMVYFTALFFSRKKTGSKPFRTIHMEDEHSITVLSLLPALAYFLWIWFKGTLTMADGVILSVIYFLYLYLLSKMPPQESEGLDDLGVFPRKIMSLPKPLSLAAIFVLLAAGGFLLWFCAHPFLESMLAMAAAMGISQFVFVQWIAPFLSEFPEKLSAFHWARKVTRAPMALTNFISSSINQWTILVATIPFIFAYGTHSSAPIVFDAHQRLEILLTITQSYLGFLFLVSMDFDWYEAVGLFVLWITQFLIPGVREEITWVYAGWAAIETFRLAVHFRKKNAFNVFVKLARERLFVPRGRA